ncbi:MAG: HEPN domain-containing protein [Deltaproteobacteria bacterium]|nr:HEPN domain-containing protein [Deltaproteobacteria bacterium]MBI3077091.1 HEPN domain-containing protein [Deltaproteobacteria bacterium]
MRQAEDDLAAARELQGSGRHNLACFMAEQAAVKALRAYLYGCGEEGMLGRGVIDLCNRAGGFDQGFLDLKRRISILDAYYLPTRYPNFLPSGIPAEVYGRDQARGAMALADEALAFVRTRLER